VSQIFISYSRRDIGLFKRLSDLLAKEFQGSHVSIWSDLQIPPGQVWSEAISKAINNSQAALILLSDDYLHSKWTTTEMSMIADHAKTTKFFVGTILASSVSNYTVLKDIDYEFSHIGDYSTVDLHHPHRPLDKLPESEQNRLLGELCMTLKCKLPFLEDKESFGNNLDKDQYAIAMDKAVQSVVGQVVAGSVNIVTGGNIFFEAEEKLNKKDDR
jgi:hypothetical protein